MNQKIQELMRQAGTDTSGKWMSVDNSEKFAELIVEECRYVMDCNKGSDQNPEWNRALSETSKKIEQHFGVE